MSECISVLGCLSVWYKRMDTLAREASLSEMFLPPTSDGVFSEGKSIFLPGVDSFLLDSALFQKGLDVQESKLGAPKAAFL